MKTNFPDFTFLKTIDQKEILYKEKKENESRAKNQCK